MNGRKHLPSFSAALLILSLFATAQALVPNEAKATLGASEDSVEADRKWVANSRHTTQTPRAEFTIHEISNDGITIREYVSSDGVVFAIAWEGITHPDLAPLLGSFAPELDETSRAAARVRGRRAFVQLIGPHIVVEKYGHMRAVKGKAYLPSLIPDGVTPNDIR